MIPCSLLLVIVELDRPSHDVLTLHRQEGFTSILGSMKVDKAVGSILPVKGSIDMSMFRLVLLSVGEVLMRLCIAYSVMPLAVNRFSTSRFCAAYGKLPT